jgi:hypothetical protein
LALSREANTGKVVRSQYFNFLLNKNFWRRSRISVATNKASALFRNLEGGRTNDFGGATLFGWRLPAPLSALRKGVHRSTAHHFFKNMTTLQRFPEKHGRRAVKQVTVNVDPQALTGCDWEQLNERINQLFAIGATEPAKTSRPIVRRDYNARRDYRGAAKLINRPMTAREAQEVLCSQLKLGPRAVTVKHWPRVRHYLKKVSDGFIYDEATAREYEAKVAALDP